MISYDFDEVLENIQEGPPFDYELFIGNILSTKDKASQKELIRARDEKEMKMYHRCCDALIDLYKNDRETAIRKMERLVYDFERLRYFSEEKSYEVQKYAHFDYIANNGEDEWSGSLLRKSYRFEAGELV